MRIGFLRGFAGVVMLTGISVTWIPYHSTIYPYTISQPSSFKHAVVSISTDEQVDLFAPSLGSATTHVTISAQSGSAMAGEISYLRSIDGRHVKRIGSLLVAGHTHPLVRAQFNGIGGKWTLEQVCFSANGFIWRLTASYPPRYKSLRSMMIRMLGSFKLSQNTR